MTIDQLPERNNDIPGSEQGMYLKYHVQRVDGADQPGEKYEGAQYLVLDLTNDPFARLAALAYADACSVMYPKLADDIKAQLMQIIDGRSTNHE